MEATDLDIQVVESGPLAARLVNELFNPAWVGLGVLGAIAAHGAQNTQDFLKWWAVSGFFLSLVPVGFVIMALRSGGVSDWYVTRAAERTRLFAMSVLSFGASITVMIIFGAPVDLLAVTLSAMGALVVALVVTPKWKLSIHTGTLSGGVVALSFVFGPWALLLAFTVPVVCWARIRVTHHTMWQVVLASVMAAALSAAVFTTTLSLA